MLLIHIILIVAIVLILVVLVRGKLCSVKNLLKSGHSVTIYSSSPQLPLLLLGKDKNLGYLESGGSKWSAIKGPNNHRYGHQIVTLWRQHIATSVKGRTLPLAQNWVPHEKSLKCRNTIFSSLKPHWVGRGEGWSWNWVNYKRAPPPIHSQKPSSEYKTSWIM